jgi:hypothetical protein
MNQKGIRHLTWVKQETHDASFSRFISNRAIKSCNRHLNATFQGKINPTHSVQTVEDQRSPISHARLLKYGCIPVQSASAPARTDSSIAQQLRQHLRSIHEKTTFQMPQHSFLARLQASGKLHSKSAPLNAITVRHR